jgi:hypothetical protein
VGACERSGAHLLKSHRTSQNQAARHRCLPAPRCGYYGRREYSASSVPIPPVVVELPPDSVPHAAAILIEACTKSLPGRGCQLASGDQAAEPRSGFALVRRRGERTLVIELGVRRDQKVRWVLRELEFRADDPEEERFFATGLVIGTLVGQAESESERAPAPSPPPVADRPRRPAAIDQSREAQPAVRPWRAAIGVDAVGGPALDQGSWRFGAGLGADYRLGLSPAFVHLGVRYAARPTDANGLSMNWASAAAGAGVQWDLSRPLKLESTAALVVERVGASATSAATGERDNGTRLAAGGRVGVGLLLVSAGFFGVFVGADGTVLVSPTRLVVAGQGAGRVQNPTYAFAVGLRARLF